MALMQIEHGSNEYNKMVQLRHNILRKPLGLNFAPQDLAAEKNDILVGAFEDGKILGCCVLTAEPPDAVRLRQMAVAARSQGKGIGHSVLRFAETLARDRGFKALTMHARDSAMGFYQKHGYKVVGERFMEVGIPHCRMAKRL
jgi:predicted GNAT family N-acyltransferase